MGVLLRHGNLRPQDVLRDFQDVFRLIVNGRIEDFVSGRCRLGVGNNLVLRLSVAHFAGGSQRQPAREMPEDSGNLHRRIRHRHVQNLVPMMKANLHRHGNGHETLQRRHFL